MHSSAPAHLSASSLKSPACLTSTGIYFLVHTPVSVEGDGVVAKALGWGSHATNLRVRLSFSAWPVSHTLWVLGVYHIHWMYPGVLNALNDSRNNCFFKLGPRRCKELMLENSVEAYANFIYFKISSKFKKNQTTLLDQDMWLTKKRNIHTTSKVCHLKRNAVIHSSTISQPAAYGS